MDEAKFMAEMAKARASDKHGERSVAYWEGFERGLRRQYHGDRFGTAQEHALWLSLANDGSDPSRRERGQGYRDGLAAKWQEHDQAIIPPCSTTTLSRERAEGLLQEWSEVLSGRPAPMTH